jgi:hypothetical protein
MLFSSFYFLGNKLHIIVYFLVSGPLGSLTNAAFPIARELVALKPALLLCHVIKPAPGDIFQ